jgi:arginyl-tRNA synthetase
MSQPPSASSSPPSPAVDPLVPLRERVMAAARAALGDAAAGADPALHRSDHADYQADIALGLARKLKRNPREVGQALAAALPPDDVIARAEVSGPGFINITLRPEYLAGALGRMLCDDRLGTPAPARPETVVVDYSSPNLAKEMHVGHIRSTIIGDALARLLEFQGHRVLRQNHVGDWGTPFGMLLEELIDARAEGREASVRELVGFYKAARAKFDSDPAFAERARRRVVLLQGGDAETLALWRRLIDISVDYFTALYERLGVGLRPEHVAGESQFNPDLPGVVDDLVKLGLARESDGAMCVFPAGFTGREGDPVPLIVRKQDGGYGYATTDLAAVRYRVGRLGATRVIYVVGAPQNQHLAMVFAVARLAGWVPENVRLEHVAFGSVLGPDKKMFKTRAGESVSLASLIDEAIERAGRAVREKSPDLDPAEQTRIAEAVGTGAVKYADLSSDRIKDYVFDWDRMLAFEGNTAPYLMYAHARIRSILRKAEDWNGDRASAAQALALEAPEEKALALELVGFPGVVEKTGETLQPHRICGQLYDIASAFTAFYEKCPVLKAQEPARSARLALSLLTARVLEQGLRLLGITAPDKM